MTVTTPKGFGRRGHQPTQALKEANRIRLYRATVKSSVASMPRREGCRETARLIRLNLADWRSCRLGYMLTMPDHVGPTTARKWLKALGVMDTRRLGQLTGRQRDLLATLVEAV